MIDRTAPVIRVAWCDTYNQIGESNTVYNKHARCHAGNRNNSAEIQENPRSPFLLGAKGKTRKHLSDREKAGNHLLPFLKTTLKKYLRSTSQMSSLSTGSSWNLEGFLNGVAIGLSRFYEFPWCDSENWEKIWQKSVFPILREGIKYSSVFFAY